MELSKNDVKMTKGLAIIFMVILHLFARKYDLPYSTSLFIGDIPLLYYIGLFGDCCVVIYCFCSGYAHWIIYEKGPKPYQRVLKRLPSLLIQFWIVCLGAIVVGMITKNNFIPGSVWTAVKSLLLLYNGYNGAWWFLLTYVLLCILSPLLIKMVKKCAVLTLIIFFVIYVFGFGIRFWGFDPFPNQTNLYWLTDNVGLLGTSALPYLVGATFRKWKVFTFLSDYLGKIKTWQKNMLLAIGMLCMFIAHCFVQSLFVAIFTGIGTIICFNLWEKGKVVENVFAFLGVHSTNIWLTHMFFYMGLFDGFIFIAKYPPLCLLLLLTITIPLSIAINYIVELINKKTILNKLN